MRKFLLTIALCLACLSASAQKPKRVVTDSVTFMPNKVQIYEGVTRNGNPKWWIEIPAQNGVKKVTLQETHVKSGRLLALIERRDEQTGKYYYSIKFAEKKPTSASGGKADLSKIK